MQNIEEGYFEPETITMLKEVLDKTWLALTPQEQQLTTKSFLARRLFYLAKDGERDPIRLRTQAIIGLLNPTRIAS